MSSVSPELLTVGPEDAAVHLLLAHGAGAPMTSPFLEALAGQLAAAGVIVSRFEFDYMATRRREGRRRPPPKAQALVGELEAAVHAVGRQFPRTGRLVIGGKSMGGRVASMAADHLYRRGHIAGLAVLGYPFHPPGKPERLRTSHLTELTCPSLIVQGERDPFGTRSEVQEYRLSKAIALCWIAGADHDLRAARGAATSSRENMALAAEAVARFCRGLGPGRR